MKVTAARFLGAAAAPGGGPPARVPEIAIAGRSNVGKSTLINALLGKRGLARTSSTPGRTRQLNFFLVNERFVLTDLPGYGFAVGSEQERRSWGPLVESYLRDRTVLRGVVLIVDARRGVEDEERQLLEFLAHVELPALLAATKLDKLAHNAGRKALAAIAASAGPDVQVLGCSGRTGDGREAIWRVLRGWLDAPPRVGHKA